MKKFIPFALALGLVGLAMPVHAQVYLAPETVTTYYAPSVPVSPLPNAATIRIAGAPLASESREQVQTRVRPIPGPRPRSLSSRSWAAAGNVAARRTIRAAGAPLVSKRR